MRPTWSREERWQFHKISTWQWGLPWLDLWNNISRQTGNKQTEQQIVIWLDLHKKLVAWEGCRWRQVVSHLDEPGGWMSTLLKVLLSVLLLDLQSQTWTQDALQPQEPCQCLNTSRAGSSEKRLNSCTIVLKQASRGLICQSSRCQFPLLKGKDTNCELLSASSDAQSLHSVWLCLIEEGVEVKKVKR